MKKNASPFGKYSYLVYRSKNLASPTEKLTGDELNHWRTFGYYDSLYIQEKENATYKDCFAIRFPAAFRGRQLLAKQVFTLIPFPDDCNNEEPRSVLLRSQNPEKKTDKDSGKEPGYGPFLGVIMIGINMLQDQSGEDKNGVDYLDKLLFYRKEIEEIIREYRRENDGGLSMNLASEILLSVNCADLCVIVRTFRIKDIYLLSKLIRLRFSLTSEEKNKDNKDSLSFAQLRYAPKISCITAMSTRLNEYGQLKRIKEESANIAVDFRLSCKTLYAERKLLECSNYLIRDKFEEDGIETDNPVSVDGRLSRETHLLSIGERMGGVLGVGHYSVHMPLYEYLTLYFGKTKRTDDADEAKPTLSGCLSLKKKNEDGGGFNWEQYEISNVRLRFCNNGSLAGLITENFSPRKAHFKNDGWKEIEGFLVKLRASLSLYRNQIHFSSYMLKEALSMINDLYYTYNDLLYEENVHSYILATQLLALSGNVLKTLKRITDESEKNLQNFRSSDFSNRRPIIDAVDELIRMINTIVLSINFYNKSLVAYSQSNLNFPNYEIQSKVNIEKYQVAYTAFVQSLCDTFPKSPSSNLPILAYVYLNLNEESTLARQCFAVSPFDIRNPDEETDLIRMLPIASPNYRRFAHLHHILPQLCHELGHHIRTLERKERNEFVYAYMLEPTAMLIEEQVIESASIPDMDYASDDLRLLLRRRIQEELLLEMYEKRPGSYPLEEMRFANLRMPIGEYLYEHLNYEQSSFKRFWTGYREILAQAGIVSEGAFHVCGGEIFEEVERLKGGSLPARVIINLSISALNYYLVRVCGFPTGYRRQADDFHTVIQKVLDYAKWKGIKSIGWEFTVYTLLDSKEEMPNSAISGIEAKVLMSVCLTLTAGVFSAYLDYYELGLSFTRTRKVDKEYLKVFSDFAESYEGVVGSLSFFSGQTMESFQNAFDAQTEKDPFRELMPEWQPSESDGGRELQIPTCEQQRNLVLKAMSYCNDMFRHSRRLKEISDNNRTLELHAERVSTVCNRVKATLNILNGLVEEHGDQEDTNEIHIGMNRIPIVIDNDVKRVERITNRIQEDFSRSPKATGIHFSDSLARRLQNPADCSRWLSEAIRQLDPDSCNSRARGRYKLYNEVSADLAMCAALRFTPFGYLAYTEHQFSERSEQTGYYTFTITRILDVTTVLLYETEQKSRYNGSVYEANREELESRIEKYLKNVGTQRAKCIAKASKLIHASNGKVDSKNATEGSFGQAEDFDSQEYSVPRGRVRTASLLVDRWLWEMDRIAYELRRIHNGEQSYSGDKDRVQDCLERITDLLGHLRTLKRICELFVLLREETEKNMSYSNTELFSEKGTFSRQTHYRRLWKVLNSKTVPKEKDKYRNKWIHLCWGNETLQHISEHYNNYDSRPGQGQEDENKEQMRFVLKYYWEGNLRYRRLRRKNFRWESNNPLNILKEWFERWGNDSYETDNS